MPEFGERSTKNLSECHKDLQDLFNEVIKTVKCHVEIPGYDCSVIEGYRGEEEQNAAYDAGKSQLQYPKSKHNKEPSMAADVCPYPIDWNDKEGFYHFAGYVKGIAKMMGIDIRWGGDWDKDHDLHDQTFFDLPHFELSSVRPEEEVKKKTFTRR